MSVAPGYTPAAVHAPLPGIPATGAKTHFDQPRRQASRPARHQKGLPEVFSAYPDRCAVPTPKGPRCPVTGVPHGLGFPGVGVGRQGMRASAVLVFPAGRHPRRRASRSHAWRSAFRSWERVLGSVIWVSSIIGTAHMLTEIFVHMLLLRSAGHWYTCQRGR